MSLGDKVGRSLRRWVNGSWGTSNSGGVTGLGGALLDTPSAVEEHG